MIRMSEAVLPGHPDKFCDQIADAIVDECYQVDPEAYCQVEVSVWSDEVWLTGGLVTRLPFEVELQDVVRKVGMRVGYVSGNAIDVSRYRVHDAVCRDVRDPREWTRHVNDQCISVGWAGYDEKTCWLPPEHFLVHGIRQRLTKSCCEGRLRREGPDGKILVRLRENTNEWILESVLVTLQQRESTDFVELSGAIEMELGELYDELRQFDRRWSGPWSDVELLVNPNGPLLNGGSDGDNGQTGRKLVMDYYGPRVPIGGGALSGKDLSHIDRAAAYAARHAAVNAVATGAKECLVRLAYAPNVDHPLEVTWEMEGRGARLADEWFSHGKMVERVGDVRGLSRMAEGVHFSDARYGWNRPGEA